MLDVRRLRLLRDLSRLGTVAAVAAAHSYTPSAVSQQLAALQREAGVALLERDGRRLRLTRAGRALVAHAETVLGALEAASAGLAAARGGLTDSVRIGAYPTAVRPLLTPALVALGREHPGLDLAVVELDPVEVPAALRERRVDVALTHDYDLVPEPPDAAVATVDLLAETVHLALPAPPAGPAGGAGGGLAGAGNGGGLAGNGGGLAAARDADWIVGSPGTLCHTVAVRACEAAGYTPRVRHHVDDFAAVLALVAAGQGAALVPDLAVREPPPGVRLVPLDIRRRTRIAYRAGAGTHPAVSACVSAVRAAATRRRRGA
jgi:DNA-binding transcriptional LysR family regulator